MNTETLAAMVARGWRRETGMTERHRAARGGMGMRVRALIEPAEKNNEAFPLPPDPPGWDVMPMIDRLAGAEVTAVIAAPDAADHTIRSTCTRCDGRGHIRRTAPDLLAESLSLADGDGPGVQLVTRFLQTLLAADCREDAESLAVDLPRLYDPADPAALARLDGVLISVGARHAALQQGLDRGLGSMTLDEFAQVKTMLLESLRRAANGAWRPEYDLAWSRAYDYAAVRIMAAAQQASLAGSPSPQMSPPPAAETIEAQPADA